MAGYDTLYHLLECEIRQRTEEGCVADGAIWDERLRLCGPKKLGELELLYEDLMELTPAAGFAFGEPGDVEAILAALAAEPAPLAKPSGKTIFEQIHGGWLGRCCGCSLGKPFQTPPFTHHPQNTQRRDIRMWLEKADAWPLEGYVPAASPAERWGLQLAGTECTRDAIRRMEPDETIQASLLSLTVLERHGRDFRTGDAARVWLEVLPFDLAAPAEAQTLANLANEEAFARNARSDSVIESLDWTAVASWHNPYREWAGAMARADVHGLAAPGDPDLAAAMAWRDARLSHTKNGVYAAMFQAALVAAAFSERDPARLVEQALGRVPRESRLAQAVRQSLEIGLEEGNWEDAWDRLMPHIGSYDPRHAIPAAALETLALLHGEGDFGRSIGVAVSCGLNPAAIGASVGMVLGVAGGVRAIPPRWAQPLNNTLRGGLPALAQTTISDTSRRSGRVLEAAIAAAKG